MCYYSQNDLQSFFKKNALLTNKSYYSVFLPLLTVSLSIHTDGWCSVVNVVSGIFYIFKISRKFSLPE